MQNIPASFVNGIVEIKHNIGLKKDWPKKASLTPGNKSIPLYIKLRITKQFVKALPKHGPCFNYLCDKLKCLNANAKIEEGIFVGAEVRKLIEEKKF